MIETVVTGQMAANCYLVFDEDSGLCTILDPGDDADYISQYLNDLKLKPEQIVATHGHFDHLMAVQELRLSYSIPFLMTEEDSFLLKEMRSSAKHFGDFDPGPPPPIDMKLPFSGEVEMAGAKFEVIPTPGHTPGSVSLYNLEAGVLLAGDVIFAGGGIGRYDFSYSDEKELRKSIDKLLTLPKETIVYPGHGPLTTIGQEKITHFI